ncbi:hypothetical protein [Szabonella alba]|uniref:Uncharacterized protein n=1 Tax=Szabonella alba TaxID=2804194 RepID=A0A8K0VCM0_9RHOB|nr:hypothetical protein [Szabonella alba]MBL4917758.1 hypothetical protein [Szabonella alba]
MFDAVAVSLIVMAITAAIGFPFWVGKNRPKKFDFVVDRYVYFLLAIFLALGIADAFYMIGQKTALPEKEMESLFFNGWGVIMTPAVIAFLFALRFFRKTVVEDQED